MRIFSRTRVGLATAAAAVVALGAFAAPAGAITDGELDGDDHPYVGIMVAHGVDPDTGKYGPLWRCTGTLLSEDLFLTAGHCTEDPATHVEIWFDSDVQQYRDPATGVYANGYPYDGEDGGTPYVHPEFYTGPFYLHDLGVVVLDEPHPMSDYGTLPMLNQLDKLRTKRGQQDVTFTAVGYGLQKSFPDAASWKDEALKIREVAYPKLNQINTAFTGDGSMILSNNASTGGTCFGDSGGPNFIGSSKVIGGVTSFGINPTCAGTGGVYRVDRADDLDWIATFMD